MNTRIKYLQPLLAIMLVTSTAAMSETQSLPNIELAYLQDLHNQSPSVDPTLSAILLNQFIEARQVRNGMDFFTQLISKSSGPTQTRYKTALAVLRASYADDVFLLKRRSWVRDTITMFNDVRAAAPDDMLVRWMTGTTLAQIPGMFNQKTIAKADLEWVLERLDQMPRDGLIYGTEREVFYQLSCLYQQEGNTEKAEEYLLISGYPDYERDATILSRFAASAEAGLTMSAPRVEEVIPGKIYSATGFEMTEYYFIVTEDGKQTISIDAGTRPETAQRAHEAVLARFPDLPLITTVVVTHTHWDHVGGHQYFRQLNPGIRFISRDNYEEELAIVKNSEPAFKFFFSADYSNDNVADYKPDQTVSVETEIDIGGTKLGLLPIAGGETEDGLFIHLPQHRLTFVGDFIMPFIGAPFAPEGNPAGLLQAIDTLGSLDSIKQLHGHNPLTDFFSPASMLVDLKPGLEWLMMNVNTQRLNGLTSAEIQQLNLIPQVVFENPDMQLPYMILREGIIQRVYEQSTGYWESNLDGMDYLSRKDIAFILKDFLGVTEKRMDGAVKQLLEQGHYDAALKVSNWAVQNFPDSSAASVGRRSALLGLRTRYQFSNPFKFLIYAESMEEGVPQLSGKW